MEGILLYFTCKYFGDWERIYDALEKQEDIDFDEMNKLKEKYEGGYTTVLSSDYPSELKHIDRPPFILFYKGDKKLLNIRNKIWYFGSYFGKKDILKVLKHKKDFKENKLTIVTGFSNDFEKSFINNIKPEGMIIVRDSGIDSHINMSKIEESSFIKKNLIVSEYPEKVIPSLHTWESSNKIKIGLTKGMFLLNSLKERTTFKLIANTIDEKREVFCYNKIIESKSHNSILIEKGAYGIEDIKEIKENG